MTAAAPNASELRAALLSQPQVLATETFANLVSPDERIAILLELATETERLATSELTQAVEMGHRLIPLADAFGNPLARTRARRASAQTLAYSGRFEEALPAYQQAIAIAAGEHLETEVARAQMSSIHALAHMGRFDEAISAGEAARATFVAAGERKLAARVDSNLGATFGMCDRPIEALARFDRAREALADEPIAMAQIDTNRGLWLLWLDRFAEANAAYAAALPVLEQAEMSWAVAIVAGHLAELAMRQGHLQAALAHFERAQRQLERDGAPVQFARVRIERAAALSLLGLHSQALADYEAALPLLRESGVAIESLKAAMGMGQALVHLARYAEARTALDRAAAEAIQLDHRTYAAQIELQRAELATRDGELGSAESHARAALEGLADRPVDQILARVSLARIEFARDDLEQAEATLKIALDDAKRLGIAPLLASVLQLQARVHRLCGRSDVALLELRNAVEQVERVRGTLQAERFRAAFQQERTQLFEELIAAELEVHPSRGAADLFLAVERSKSRLLLDLARSSHADLDDGADAGESSSASEIRRLHSELNALYSRLADARFVEAAPEAIDRWQQTIRVLEDRLTELTSRVATVRGATNLFAPPTPLSEVQQSLGNRTALIEYFESGGALHALVIRKHDAHVRIGLSTTDAANKAAEQIHFQLRRAARPGATDGPRGDRLLEDVRRELAGAGAALIAPLLPVVDGCDELVFVPHGPLHMVPFHALVIEDDYLLRRFAIRSVPSAALLAAAQARATRRAAEGTMLIVGVADEHAPGIRTEVLSLSTAIPSARTLIDADATVEAVCQTTTNAARIHIACHGHFSAEHTSASGLRLWDRWLTTRDIYSLRLPDSLVTLSSCEAGRSAVTAGDELLGIVRAFFAAGAATTIVSLWPVHDDSTTELMTTFYSKPASGEGNNGPCAALRRAQLRLAAERRHPYFWAPFVCIGAA